MNEDDIFVVDITSDKPKKRKNSGRKGKRGERELAKLLTERFPGREAFSRVVGSGNRWAQASLTQEAKTVLTGDLVCPVNFRFCIESKYGYEGIDLFVALRDGVKPLDEFLKQAETDANRVNKKPLLFWKKPRQHWLIFTKEKLPSFEYVMTYRDWTVINLDRLLTMPDSFFFNECNV